MGSHPKLYSKLSTKYASSDEFEATITKAIALRTSVSRLDDGGFAVPSTSATGEKSSGPQLHSLRSKSNERHSMVTLLCGSPFCSTKATAATPCAHRLSIILKYFAGSLDEWIALLASYKKRGGVAGEKASRTESRRNDDDLNHAVGGTTKKKQKANVSAKRGPGADSKPSTPAKGAKGGSMRNPAQQKPRRETSEEQLALQKRKAKLHKKMMAFEKEQAAVEKEEKDMQEKGDGGDAEAEVSEAAHGDGESESGNDVFVAERKKRRRRGKLRTASMMVRASHRTQRRSRLRALVGRVRMLTMVRRRKRRRRRGKLKTASAVARAPRTIQRRS